MRPAAPPRLARALLRLVTPPADRPFLLDDLDEEFQARARSGPPGEARRWYRVQALTSALPLLRRRISILAAGRDRSMTFDALRQDLSFALRSFARRPGFTLVAVVTLGLGVGATTAIFSLVNGVLLGAVPGLGDTRGLVEISRNLDGLFFDVSLPVYRGIAEETPGLEALAGFDLEPVSVGGSGEPSATLSLSVTATYFEVLGIDAGRGRFFADEEASPPRVAPVAVVSDHLWRTRLGGSPSAVGSEVRVNGSPLTVIGVAPPGFRGHTRLPVDVFLPLGVGLPGLRSPETLVGAESGVVELLGRVAAGADLDDVEAAATRAGSAVLRSELGAGSGTFRARVEPWGPIPAVGRGPVSAFLFVLLAVVGTVLAVAALNVAGMLVARSMERESEIAVRRALGAGRGRIVRQLLTESVLLFAAGGALGVLLSSGLTRLLLAFEPPLPPGFELPLDLGVDGRVLAFASLVTVATAVTFNLLPALRASRSAPAAGLTAGDRRSTGGRGRTSGLVVGAQMAGCTTLLVVAGLFLRSLETVRGLDPGWETEGIYSVDLDMALAGIDEAAGRAAYAELERRLGGLPGVQSVALAAKLPLAGRSSFGDVSAPGVEPPPGRPGFEAALNRVTPGYFRTLGVDLLAGRAFGPGDAEGGEPVAVVNRRMAELLWPGGDPVGRRFWLGPVGSDRSFTVVGVVENTAVSDLTEDPGAFYYLPAAQWYNAQMTAFVRVAPGPGDGPVAAVRSAVREVAPQLPVGRVLPLEERLAVYFLPQRLAAWVTGMVGALGLVLAAVGVYGLTAFTVGRRVREIGVRLALGAAPRTVLFAFVRRGMRAPAAGIAVGLVLSVVLARLAGGFLAGVAPVDPTAWGGAVALLAGAALVAAAVPASRAARTDPAETLRAE